jgi:2-dehydro-3-deoxyphosphooctonate aldolase (KDO 8-P synthase)
MKLCGFDVGLNQPFFLIAGTCSIEGLEMSLEVAGQLKEICTALGIPLIYKGSFDKANRSSGSTQRGVGIDAGLKILDEVRRQIGVPIPVSYRHLRAHETD